MTEKEVDDDAGTQRSLAVAIAGRGWRSRVGEPREPAARRLTKVTLQLKWVTQAQFAGYYAAQAKGYYKKAGLDVTIKAGGPDIIPEQVVLGEAGRVRHRLAAEPARAARRPGQRPRQHRARSSRGAGMTELTWKYGGINTITKMKGKKVGVWLCGNEFELFAALTKNGIDPQTRTSRSSSSRST